MNPKLIKTLKNFWPITLWALFVFILSAIPGNSIPRLPSFFDWLKPDKIVHLVFYGVFTFLLLHGLVKQYGAGNKRFMYKIVAFNTGMVFGLLMEVLQYYEFSGRNGNIYDFIANTIGSLIGIWIFSIYKRKKLVK
ncbi:MAG: VanZ family protein [Bacteroidota bacterium]|nr:VanZ family protein [Bacteroidota bacterium]